MTVRPGPWARLVALGALAAAVGGCLPSDQRELDRSVSAADSASVALAATAPVDTLAEAWTARAPDADPMPIPTSLAWAGDALAVAETQGGTVRRFAADGRYLGRTAVGPESYPYVAGARGDTLVVLARGADELRWVVPGAGVVRRVPAPAGATAAFAGPGRLAARVGGGPDGAVPEVVRLDEAGAEAGRARLAGPAWRSRGRLVAWGDTLVALSGYRPVLDLVGEGAADTLALVGFASPQLARSAQFARGDVDEPPLLSSSAAALGDALLVLNLRADHLRVDVYGRDGRLRRALVSPGPWRPLEHVALDVAARRRGGAVELAVLWARPPGVLVAPDAYVTLYRWRAGGAEAAARAESDG